MEKFGNCASEKSLELCSFGWEMVGNLLVSKGDLGTESLGLWTCFCLIASKHVFDELYTDIMQAFIVFLHTMEDFVFGLKIRTSNIWSGYNWKLLLSNCSNKTNCLVHVLFSLPGF